MKNFALVVMVAALFPSCAPAYPTLCLPPTPDLNCAAIKERNFPVLSPDPHGLDADADGLGCEDEASLQEDEASLQAEGFAPTFSFELKGNYVVNIFKNNNYLTQGIFFSLSSPNDKYLLLPLYSEKAYWLLSGSEKLILIVPRDLNSEDVLGLDKLLRDF